jgi:hypothetical protein
VFKADYYKGLTEQQIKEKFPSKDKTLFILLSKLKDVTTDITYLLRNLEKML